MGIQAVAPLSTSPRSAAAHTTDLSASKTPSVYEQVYGATPRGTLLPASAAMAATTMRATSPRAPMSSSQRAVPHLQHHFGYGWGDGPSSLDASTSWNLRSARDLSATSHPFLSMRLPGEPALHDTLPPRASRKPVASDATSSSRHGRPPHESHVLSWPGYAR